jgi:glycosyltransferase involved in cell wall biosynthesis
MGLEFDRNVQMRAYPILLQELAKFQPDLIHVDEPERLQLGFIKIPAVDFAKRTNTPCVAFLHTNLIEYLEDYFNLPKLIIRLMQWISRRIVAFIYNAYDLTLVSSEVTYQMAVKMGIKRVIKSELLGINLDEFNPSLRSAHFFSQQFGLSDSDQAALNQKVKLVFLGRLTPDKGWKEAIAAFQQMAGSPQHRDWLTNVALIIAGDGPLYSEIAESLKALPLTVHLLGRVDPSVVPALLVNSDIHITFSEKETRGLTLLEAFAAGIPVLAPAAGGVVDTVQSGQTGFLFQPRQWQDFAAKLQPLVTQPSLRQTMGAAARQEATHYGWDQAVDRLLQIWEQQIARRKAA